MRPDGRTGPPASAVTASAARRRSCPSPPATRAGLEPAPTQPATAVPPPDVRAGDACAGAGGASSHRGPGKHISTTLRRQPRGVRATLPRRAAIPIADRVRGDARHSAHLALRAGVPLRARVVDLAGNSIAFSAQPVVHPRHGGGRLRPPGAGRLAGRGPSAPRTPGESLETDRDPFQLRHPRRQPAHRPVRAPPGPAGLLRGNGRGPRCSGRRATGRPRRRPTRWWPGATG